MNKINLEVENGEIDSYFLESDIKTRRLIINLGARMFQQGRKTILDNEVKQFQEEVIDNQIKEATKVLEIENHNLQNMLSQSEKNIEVCKSRISTLEDLHGSIYNDHNRDKERLIEKHLQEIDNLHKEKDVIRSQQIEGLQETDNKFFSEILTRVDETNTLMNSFCGSNSSEKGKLGEISFKNLLDRDFIDYQVLDMHKIPDSGDFICTHRVSKMEIMFDVKNYTDTVRGKEITKLKKDIDNLLDKGHKLCVSVLVSLNTGISTVDNISIKLYRNVIILCLPHFFKNSYLIFWYSLINNLSLMANNPESLDKKESATILMQKFSLVQKEMSRLSGLLKDQDEIRLKAETIERSAKKHANAICKLVNNTQKQIKHIIDNILNLDYNINLITDDISNLYCKDINDLSITEIDKVFKWAVQICMNNQSVDVSQDESSDINSESEKESNEIKITDSNIEIEDNKINDNKIVDTITLQLDIDTESNDVKEKEKKVKVIKSKSIKKNKGD
jgi:hypothetical protein